MVSLEYHHLSNNKQHFYTKYFFNCKTKTQTTPTFYISKSYFVLWVHATYAHPPNTGKIDKLL